jgi:hypothetical protein
VSAAVLANEKGGALQLEMQEGRLVARFNCTDPPWPPDSLEDRLRRAHSIPVSTLVYDWLADGSNFPYKRALRLIEQQRRVAGAGRD